MFLSFCIQAYYQQPKAMSICLKNLIWSIKYLSMRQFATFSNINSYGNQYKEVLSLRHVFEKVLPPRFIFLKTDPILPHPELPLVRDGVLFLYAFFRKTLAKKT